MIDPAHTLPTARQAELAGIACSTVHCLPQPTSPEDLAPMRRIDELHPEHVSAGSRMLRDMLRNEGGGVRVAAGAIDARYPAPIPGAWPLGRRRDPPRGPALPRRA